MRMKDGVLLVVPIIVVGIFVIAIVVMLTERGIILDVTHPIEPIDNRAG